MQKDNSINPETNEISNTQEEQKSNTYTETDTGSDTINTVQNPTEPENTSESKAVSEIELTSSQKTETVGTTETKSEQKSKKRKPFILRLILSLLLIVFLLILVLAGWMTACALNKKSSLSALPRDYSLYVRTDSLWDSLEPLLDLKAADILLADEPLLQFRELFLELRASELRNKFYVSYALSRRIDAALYDNNDFLAIIDMGWFAGITRLSPSISRFISVPNLIYAVSGEDSCFEYRINSMNIYAKPFKNLVLITNNKNILHSSISEDHEKTYTNQELLLLTKKLDQPFRIAADGKKLISLLQEENPYLSAITSALSTKELSEIKFGVTDENIELSVKIPFEIEENLLDNPLVKLLQRESQVPAMLSKLPESVQYYTFITAGNLSDLKDASFTAFADNQELNLAKKWQDANSVSKMMFKESLENILFSWTADEYAVIGIEGKAEPIFAIKIADEIQRKYIFDTILSSIVFKTDNSLLMDGIRLPRIEFPQFLQSLLEAFGVNLPKPYYMVKDNYVYFSQSPENLACVNAAVKSGDVISKNEIWQKVSQKHNTQSSMSLFYNLERSIPFFIKKQSIVSDILHLYNIGRADVMTKNNTIYITLQASAQEAKSSQHIPGFPVSLESKVVPVLHKSQQQKSKLIFWQEDNKIIKAFNTQNLSTASKEIDSLGWILPSSENQNSDNELWALSKEGVAYLLKGNLETSENFPVITSYKPVSAPAVYKNKLIYFTYDGVLVLVNEDGGISIDEIDVMNDIRSAPSVFGNTIEAYEKGFSGTIHTIEGEFKDMIFIDGIAFGSPCVGEIEGQQYTAFITQAGLLTVWNKSNSLIYNFPVQLDGVFYENVKIAGEYIIALSSDGTLFKIDLSGNVTAVKIPYLSAKTAYITVYDYNNDGKDEIFICGESNAIYGFNLDLEYLYGFPVSGFGKPVFADVNGDNNLDCITLTIDNKLNAWKVN